MTNLPDFTDKVEYSWDGTPHNSSSKAVYSRGIEFVNLAKNPRGVGATGMVPYDSSRWTVEKNKDVPQPHPLGITKGFVTYPLDSDEYGVSIYNVDGNYQQTTPYRNASIWIYTFVSNAEARFGGPTEPFTDVPYQTWFKLKSTITLSPETTNLRFYLRSKYEETDGSTYSTAIMVWEDGTEEPPGYFDGDSPTETFGVLPWTPYLSWTDRQIENGVDRGVAYLDNSAVAWHGLTAVSESPDTLDIESYYLDGVRRLNVPSTYEVDGEISAFSLPEALSSYLGMKSIALGFYGSNIRPKPFGLSYRTRIGGAQEGYKIHILYNVTMNPTSKEFETLSDSSDPSEFSWEFKTMPVRSGVGVGSSSFELDSRLIDPVKLATIESILYGYDVNEARLPTPDEIVDILAAE